MEQTFFEFLTLLETVMTTNLVTSPDLEESKEMEKSVMKIVHPAATITTAMKLRNESIGNWRNIHSGSSARKEQQ